MTSPWDNADHAAVEARRSKAIALANRGLTYRQVAEQMIQEYRETTRNADLTLVQCTDRVSLDVHRALKEYRKRTEYGMEERVAGALMRFQDIRRNLYRIIATRHLHVTPGGRIVEGPDGEPLRDDGPVLAALAQLIQLEDRQARVEGTYAREKLDIALSRRVEDEATDVVEAILAGFGAVPELGPEVRQRALEAAGAHLRTIEGEVVETPEGPDTV